MSKGGRAIAKASAKRTGKLPAKGAAKKNAKKNGEKKRLTKRFRAGVGAVILNKQGQVMAFERRDVPGAWQMPQGGVELDESIESALYREIREETGLSRRHLKKKFEVPFWLGYEYPSSAAGTKKGRGQVHKWFFLELVGDTRTVRVMPGTEFTAWRWCDLADLVESVLPYRRGVYLELLRLAAFAGL